ncbi:MAG: succinate dehydrogenase, cytochrome b556 subunit [Hyphomicrobiaceae bacterium]|nr:succinate dehydrogenase, cytochrome b556 subunit [Caldilineaceae bacterium]MCB1515413.1 succinate dehydrogenase, cytochrome b556 subunit [Hyphomicrobiaceae bacterium]MCC0007371.1 succinate dehydrogenase, cytochrome b556 subunit [Hyphomicrobiaceae bacterium]
MAEAKSLRGARAERPLSPHLQVYAMPINMLMSIVHRITGAALYFGSLLLAWWLVAAAAGPDYFNWVNAIYGSLPGRLVLFGYTWALMHHMMGGIRHFIWDTGRGYDLKTIDGLAWGTLLASIILTALVWLAVWVVG